MVNYNLEKFRNWLEENPQRKRNLPHWTVYSQGNYVKTIIADNFEEACRESRFDSNTLRPYQQIFCQWKAEVDEKQKEQSWENIKKISELVLLSDNFDFSTLENEIKRLKIQDLTIQIPLKKQELEQLTNNFKQKLTRAEQYPLEKLLKKHAKTLQGDNSMEKVNELKEILSEKLTNEELKTLLDKQKEVFNLEKHLESLQTEQVAQIQQANLPPQN